MNNDISIPPQGADSLLTAREAAAFLSLSPATLAAWRVRGGGPSFLKLNRAVRYRKSTLIAWIEVNTHQNTAQSSSEISRRGDQK